METISIRRDVWENMQSALAKLVHHVVVPFDTPLDVLARAEAASELSPSEQAQVDVDTAQLELDKARQRTADLAAEDATFEGRTEFAGLFSDMVTAGFNALSERPIPYTPTPRTFERGDIIPDDVHTLEIAGVERKDFRYVNRKADGTFGYLHTLHGWGESDTGPTGNGFWQPDDFPLTEVLEPVTFRVGETVEFLKAHGVDTDLTRLSSFLINGICWLDFYGNPRDCAKSFVGSASEDFVSPIVTFTPAGLAELLRVMKVAV